MAEFGPNGGPTPDLEAMARTDRFIDALAAGEQPACGDVGDEALAALLGGWRDELRWPPATGLVSERQAVAALHSGAAPRRRGHFGVTLIGSAAATVLILGGLGAVVVGAHPGDALYGVRTMLFGESQHLRDERITLTAKGEMDNIQQMITQGQWDQAQDRLTALTDTVQTVNDTGRKQDLVDQVNRLNVQVQQHDPNATAPPDSTPNPGLDGNAPATTPVILLAPTPESTSDPASATTSTTTTTTTSAQKSPTTTSGTTTSTTTTTSSPAGKPSSAAGAPTTGQTSQSAP